MKKMNWVVKPMPKKAVTENTGIKCSLSVYSFLVLTGFPTRDRHHRTRCGETKKITACDYQGKREAWGSRFSKNVRTEGQRGVSNKASLMPFFSLWRQDSKMEWKEVLSHCWDSPSQASFSWNAVGIQLDRARQRLTIGSLTPWVY